MNNQATIGVEDAVKADRVHGSLYVSQRLFELETQRIWDRVWVYVGHESEIPNPGSYKRSVLGSRPILLTQDADKKINVFFNRCRHRANLLCQQETGNARSLRCPYHGWTYALDGRLLAPTFDSAYDSRLRKEEFSLTSVPRVAIYRGLIFASAAADGPSLHDHLGEARSFLDLILDRSPIGEVRLTAGTQKMRYAGNWKMLPENSLEGAYHGHFIHKFTFSMIDGRTGRDRSQMANDSVRYLPGGHMVEDFRSFELPVSKNPLPHRISYLAALRNAYGDERARELAPGRAPILYIFPNLMFVQTHFRTLQAVKPNLTFVHSQPLLLQGVEDAINEDILRSHETSFGPAGFLSPDDMEILERTQIALARDGDEWLFIGRGIHREKATSDGGSIGHCMDENHLRGFWRHYKDLMSEGQCRL